MPYRTPLVALALVCGFIVTLHSGPARAAETPTEQHDAKNTAAKWAAYFRSPPSSIGAGTIFHLANEAKPGWRTDGPKVIWERDAPPIGPDQDRRAAYESSGDVDAQPVDLWAELAMPSLPEGALPDVIQNLAQHQATLMGVDPGGMAAAALTVCAAAIPDRIQVQVKEHDDGWVESARLWVGLVGLPSTKKTPLTSVAVRPLENIDAELYRKYAEAKEAYDALP